MMQSVTARAIVMPLESSDNVVCDARVVSGRTGKASQNVNDPLLESVHTVSYAQITPAGNPKDLLN